MEVCPSGPPVLFSIRVFIVLVMDTYTVILGYLDNSSDYSLEHVQADSPKRAIECAKIAKWSGKDDFDGQDEIDALKAMKDEDNQYHVFGCFLGELKDLNPDAA